MGGWPGRHKEPLRCRYTIPGKTLDWFITKIIIFLCYFMRRVEKAWNFDSKT
jgi:hypothetical protein